MKTFDETHLLGHAPWLGVPETGSMKFAKAAQCKAKCASLKECKYGTYISGGERNGECWLAAQTRLVASSDTALDECGVPCESFFESGQPVPGLGSTTAPSPSPGLGSGGQGRR